MREILFRGKRTDNNTWVHGSLVTMTNDVSYGNSKVCSNIHIIENGEMDMRCFLRGAETMIDNDVIQIHKESVGQYTGIKDKNGIKIFEGDIIEYDEDGYQYRAMVVFKNGMFYSENNIADEFRISDLSNDTTIEVVGNIHDNPELIK